MIVSEGFSGIDQISKDDNAEFLQFSDTVASAHVNGSTVLNLSNLFLQTFFSKFKTEFFLWI